jgi:hypothetical protein
MPINFTKEEAYTNHLSRLRGHRPAINWRLTTLTVVGIAIIAFAVFLAWDDMMALLRDAVDIVEGWSQ